MTCKKQTVVAVIQSDRGTWVGTNACRNPQTTCPREGMPTGEGYDLCRDICGQDHHAEVAACIAAGTGALGGTLYLHGHSYLCDPCREVCRLHGVIETVVVTR